jgi:hypothetical protein
MVFHVVAGKENPRRIARGAVFIVPVSWKQKKKGRELFRSSSIL